MRPHPDGLFLTVGIWCRRCLLRVPGVVSSPIIDQWRRRRLQRAALVRRIFSGGANTAPQKPRMASPCGDRRLCRRSSYARVNPRTVALARRARAVTHCSGRSERAGRTPAPASSRLLRQHQPRRTRVRGNRSRDGPGFRGQAGPGSNPELQTFFCFSQNL
jgi:hypothetical protein